MKKRDELKEDDVILYQHEATFENNDPQIRISIEKITKVFNDTFDTKDQTGLQKYRISKVIVNGNFVDYEGFDEERTIRETAAGYNSSIQGIKI